MSKSRVLLFPGLLALLAIGPACTDKAADDTGGPATDGGSSDGGTSDGGSSDGGSGDGGSSDGGSGDGGSGDGGSGDGGSGDGGSESPYAACFAQEGIVGVGTTWRYESEPGSTVMREIVYEVTELDEAAGTVLINGIDVQTYPGGSTRSDLDRDYACTEGGFFLTHVQGETVSEYKGTESKSATTTAYDEPLLLRPLGLAVGSTWTADFVGAYIGSDGSESPFDYSIDYEVVGTKETTVGGEAWETLVIQATQEDGTVGTHYFAPGLGVTVSGVTELVEYVP